MKSTNYRIAILVVPTSVAMSVNDWVRKSTPMVIVTYRRRPASRPEKNSDMSPSTAIKVLTVFDVNNDKDSDTQGIAIACWRPCRVPLHIGIQVCLRVHRDSEVNERW
jgi:hypothetical protein